MHKIYSETETLQGGAIASAVKTIISHQRAALAGDSCRAAQRAPTLRILASILHTKVESDAESPVLRLGRFQRA